MRGVGAVCAALALSLGAAAAPASAARAAPDTLQRQFGAAAARYHVPRSVLLGVAYLESRWDGHHGAPSVAGGYGPMHLTDARIALARTGARPRAASGDARGDRSRPREHDTSARPRQGKRQRKPPARLRTLVKAARLTGLPAAALRTDPDANLRGGAALLADAQRRLGRPLADDPSDWYGAVAAYSGADDAGTAKDFADEVFAVIRDGQARVTDTGQRVVLAPDPGVRTERGQADRLGLRGARAGDAECPPDLACEWLPAAYAQFKGDDGTADYGNHDLARRPADQKIRYIVVHDVEGSYDSALTEIRDPRKVSWHYTVRSADGHVAQHVRHRDVAWHAGNWQINSQSVGIEHEGFLAAPDSWFTEAMYRSSARLVRWIARRYGIPLDRLHILGHDNVPAPTPAAVPDMHTDPGPYWDWQHYFTLLGRPFAPAADRAATDVVTIRPDYPANRPAYTSCSRAGDTCPPHGSGAVRLRTAPDADAPLVADAGLHPGGAPSTTGVNDVGARASTGQRFAVAGRRGGWTAIWYLGRKAWFRNAGAVPGRAPTVTPKPGVRGVRVYGRALPEKEAYPQGVTPERITPLPYTIRPGQRYVSGGTVRGEHYRAVDFRGRDNRVVRGRTLYHEIQFGHRVAFVRADQVREEG